MKPFWSCRGRSTVLRGKRERFGGRSGRYLRVSLSRRLEASMQQAASSTGAPTSTGAVASSKLASTRRSNSSAGPRDLRPAGLVGFRFIAIAPLQSLAGFRPFRQISIKSISGTSNDRELRPRSTMTELRLAPPLPRYRGHEQKRLAAHTRKPPARFGR